MKNKKDEIKELIDFVGKEAFISTGLFPTMRGREFQITYHELPDNPASLWMKVKFALRIIFTPTPKADCIDWIDHDPMWGGDGYFCVKCGEEFILKEQTNH